MKSGTFIAGNVLLIIAAAHTVRFLAGFPVSVGTVIVPLWISAVGAVAFGTLGWVVLREHWAWYKHHARPVPGAASPSPSESSPAPAHAGGRGVSR